ncbi:MAG: hypothetical protein HONBIEJF_00339 [Fimbriimonadaceae bacterium]|nr:hypothetical protein [Fimbriimonadaceae bacterium]
MIAVVAVALMVRAAGSRPSHSASLLHAERDLASQRYKDAAVRCENIVAALGTSRKSAERIVAVRAQMIMGYAAGRQKDFSTARTEFLRAAELAPDDKASTNVSQQLEDQARYQAAVCLLADGRTEQGRSELRELLNDNPTSKLARPIRGRLGEATDSLANKPEWEPPANQNRMGKASATDCGPQSINRLLSVLGRDSLDEAVLRTACGTDASGTSVKGMQAGLKLAGLQSYAYRVNRDDFAALPLPAIWLSGEHFRVLESRNGRVLWAYDPATKETFSVDPAKLSRIAFSTVVVTTHPITHSKTP